VIISLDGATPRIVDQLNANGHLNPNEGINLLRAKGFSALQNITIAPSLTAPAHIAIATGSIAAANDAGRRRQDRERRLCQRHPVFSARMAARLAVVNTH
jgi:hypothetical protein